MVVTAYTHKKYIDHPIINNICPHYNVLDLDYKQLLWYNNVQNHCTKYTRNIDRSSWLCFCLFVCMQENSSRDFLQSPKSIFTHELAQIFCFFFFCLWDGGCKCTLSYIKTTWHTQLTQLMFKYNSGSLYVCVCTRKYYPQSRIYRVCLYDRTKQLPPF